MLYDVGFSSSRLLNTGTPPTSNQSEIADYVDQCSSLTTFVNVAGPPSPPTDWLFLGLVATGEVLNYNVSLDDGLGVTGAGFPAGFTNVADYPVAGGPSGFIVDNQSAEAQASSIYFSGVGSSVCGVGGAGHCAVKLTQEGLE